MSELTRRVIFAIPAGALFIWLFWIGGTPLRVALGLLSMAGVIELVRMASSWQPRTSLPLAVSLAIALWVVPLLNPTFRELPLYLLLAPVFLLALRRGSPFSGWETTTWVGIYAPAGLYAVWLIREGLPAGVGLWVALGLLGMIWANDTFAYLGGRQFGKRKLAPAISPNKTWEGFFCGMAGALLVALLLGFLNSDKALTPGMLLPMAVIVSMFGPAGDLLASYWKRSAGVKDSSTLFPGHGGMMDRFDSLVLAAPVCWLYLQFWFRSTGQ